MKKILAISFLCFISEISMVSAQNIDSLNVDDLLSMTLEDLMKIPITTASKTSETLKDATAVVSVITSKDIELYGALSLKDVLDRATNVYFTSGFSYRNNMVSIRGNVTAVANTNILILVDGRPFRESLDNGTNASIYNAFPLDRVERIEIIRGPGSVLYGTCALTGIINIITKSVSNTAPITASVNYGTFNTIQAQVGGAKKIGKLEIVGGVNYLDSDGWKFSAYGAPTVTVLGTIPSAYNTIKMYEKSFGSNVNLSYGNFKLLTNYMHSTQANMGSTDATWFNKLVGDDRALEFNSTIDRLLIDLGYDKKINDFWRTTINITFNNMSRSREYPYLPNFKDKGQSNDYLVEFTNYIKPLKNMNLIVGGLTNTQTGNAKNYAKIEDLNSPIGFDPINVFDPTIPLNSNPIDVVKNYNQTWWSIYAQGDYQVTSFLKLVAGAQGNKVIGRDIYIAPRAGGILNFSKSTGVKILYGKAFRSPTILEKEGSDFPDIFPNNNLKAETIGTFETQFFFTKSKFETYITYYNSFQTNIIRKSITNEEKFPVEIGPGVTALIPGYINAGNLRSQGVEIETKAFISTSFTFNTGFSYQTTKDSEGNKDDYGMPKVMLKGGLTYSFPFNLQVGLFNSFYSKGGNINKANTTINNPEAKAYNYLSANIQYKISKHFIAGVFVTNILDEKIYYPEYLNRNINTLPGRAGRAINGSIKYRF